MRIAINPKRMRVIRGGEIKGPVVYWMSRDQRVADNWSLIYALGLARELNEPVAVVFCIAPGFLNATGRSYKFMIDGLRKVEHRLKGMNVTFMLLHGEPVDAIPSLIDDSGAGILVTDFSPLRISLTWKSRIAERVSIPIHEVDAHNIVPCWIASEKQEWSAQTFRRKIKKHLPEFLERFPEINPPLREWKDYVENDWSSVESSLNLKAYTSAPYLSGEDVADEQLKSFIKGKLEVYALHHNNPTKDAESGLSPYLHFGQISAQRVALAITNRGDYGEFLDELIVRRELSDNFCYYNDRYDSFNGLPEWARKTLNDHRGDRREYLYTLAELEEGRTHDDLWNAAQLEMLIKGKMHGYMRMYWAKKILEWSESPEIALSRAIYLNDRYELDGRDPNGYVGCAWSIGGLHDRPFRERPIFGKIRYMSYEGLRRKFDVEEYKRRITMMSQ